MAYQNPNRSGSLTPNNGWVLVASGDAKNPPPVALESGAFYFLRIPLPFSVPAQWSTPVFNALTAIGVNVDGVAIPDNPSRLEITFTA